MLSSPRWSHLASRWDDPVRRDLVLAWHRLRGWKDSSPGLAALKERVIIGTLSNGNVRLLIDMVCGRLHAAHHVSSPLATLGQVCSSTLGRRLLQPALRLL